MKRHLRLFISSLCAALFLSSCISSILKEAPPTFSKDISYEDPTKDFTKLSKSVFPAWKNKSTSNVISIISDCSESNIYTLDDLHQLISGSLEKPNVVSKESIQFKGKPAQKRKIEGEIDGNAIEIRALSFRRNNCGYVSSLSGRPDTIEHDEKAYEQFNESLNFK